MRILLYFLSNSYMNGKVLGNVQCFNFLAVSVMASMAFSENLLYDKKRDSKTILFDTELINIFSSPVSVI